MSSVTPQLGKLGQCVWPDRCRAWNAKAPSALRRCNKAQSARVKLLAEAVFEGHHISTCLSDCRSSTVVFRRRLTSTNHRRKKVEDSW